MCAATWCHPMAHLMIRSSMHCAYHRPPSYVTQNALLLMLHVDSCLQRRIMHIYWLSYSL